MKFKGTLQKYKLDYLAKLRHVIIDRVIRRQPISEHDRQTYNQALAQTKALNQSDDIPWVG